MRDVAVVISVYSISRADDVVKCIDSVMKQTVSPKEILVVLDPDEDLVAFYKERLRSSVKIVVSDCFGLSSARNAGVRNSESEIIAFIDDDAVADERWLENSVRNYDDPSVIGVGGRIEPLWHEEKPGWLPEELYWVVGCSYKGHPTKKAVIRNPIGCNMSFRRSAIEKAGYFSNDMGRIGNKLLGHEDTEFGIRATSKLLGTKIVYDPAAVVHHVVPKERATFRYVVRRSYAEGFSKAALSKGDVKDKDALSPERRYLIDLILDGIPNRLSAGGKPESVFQIIALLASTIFVLSGYLRGRCG